jgi:DNA-binding Lrp family transcriptional regulator
MYAYILVEVPAGSPREVSKRIEQLKGVIEARSVYGSHYDIIVRAEAEERADFSKITDDIQSLGKGILTATLEAMEG